MFAKGSNDLSKKATAAPSNGDGDIFADLKKTSGPAKRLNPFN